MKMTLVTVVAFLFTAFVLPASYAVEKSSVTKKDDSVAKTAVKVKATSNVVKKEDDSVLKKAVKLKILKKASE